VLMLIRIYVLNLRSTLGFFLALPLLVAFRQSGLIDFTVFFEGKAALLFLLGHFLAVAISKTSQVDHLRLLFHRLELIQILLLLEFSLLPFVGLAHSYLAIGILNFIKQASDDIFDFHHFFAISRHGHVFKSFNFGLLFVGNVKT